jgi:hypothetical protein
MKFSVTLQSLGPKELEIKVLKYLETVSGQHLISSIQKNTVLGTSHIKEKCYSLRLQA